MNIIEYQISEKGITLLFNNKRSVFMGKIQGERLISHLKEFDILFIENVPIDISSCKTLDDQVMEDILDV